MTAHLLGMAVRVALVLATALIFGIIFLAYLRVRNSKMLLISAGFGLQLFYALLAIPEVFAEPLIIDENLHLLLHLVSLTFILLGILKDSNNAQG